MNSPNDNLFLSSEEELRAVVQRAKFMVPTTRRKVEKEEVGNTVSQGTEGDVVVTGVSTRSTVTYHRDDRTGVPVLQVRRCGSVCSHGIQVRSRHLYVQLDSIGR